MTTLELAIKKPGKYIEVLIMTEKAQHKCTWAALDHLLGREATPVDMERVMVKRNLGDSSYAFTGTNIRYFYLDGTHIGNILTRYPTEENGWQVEVNFIFNT